MVLGTGEVVYVIRARSDPTVEVPVPHCCDVRGSRVNFIAELDILIIIMRIFLFTSNFLLDR